MKTAEFPRLLAAFFTDRLMQQRQASPHTIASYGDTFRLLVRHARKVLKKAPTELELGDLDTDFLGALLNHLEDERGNDARTRNTRLAAIRSFFGYVASHEPQHAALAQRVLAMPNKRHTRRPMDFLNRDEVEALLQAPDLRTRPGRRDHTLLLVAVQTGLRASELFGLRCRDADPAVDATNWRAEQAIRPAVVIRKVCGGNQTRRQPKETSASPDLPRSRPIPCPYLLTNHPVNEDAKGNLRVARPSTLQAHPMPVSIGESPRKRRLGSFRLAALQQCAGSPAPGLLAACRG